MDEVKNYKVLSEIDGFEVGETVTSDEFTESELEVYLSEGRLELINEDADLPAIDDDAKDDDADLPTGDQPEAPTAPAPVAREGKAKYKIIGEVAIKDGQGQTQGHYPIGSVHEFECGVGDAYVALGSAEEVLE